MREFALLFVVVSVAACGDGSPSRLVSADAGLHDADGCVAPESRPRRAPKTWLVREGDSLWLIARKVYGDEKLWKAIADANSEKIGRGDVLRAGVELTIPYDGF